MTGKLRERIDRMRATRLGDEAGAGQPVGPVYGHGAGAAHALPAGTAERERRVDLALDPDQRIENHRPAIVEIDLEGIEPRIAAGFRIVAVDLEGLHALRAGGAGQ